MPLIVSALAWLAPVTPAIADSPILEPDYGNLFMCGQHALAAELRYQSFAALLEGARVLNTKGMCYRDNDWLHSFKLATDIVRWDANRCIQHYACQGYFLFDTIEPGVREPIALAVHVALTESPQVPRYHFDSAAATPAYWWSSRLACPNGWWVVGDMRFC